MPPWFTEQCAKLDPLDGTSMAIFQRSMRALTAEQNAYAQHRVALWRYYGQWTVLIAAALWAWKVRVDYGDVLIAVAAATMMYYFIRNGLQALMFRQLATAQGPGLR